MKILKEEKNGLLYYNGYNLLDLAKKYGTPLKITFLDVIKEHITSLKQSFDKAIKELNYQGKMIYLNANKANYGYEEIKTAYHYADGLETSSYYDLLLTRKMFGSNKEKYIVSNGYKLSDYLDEFIDLHQNGYNVIDIIDSISEYEYLKKKKTNINVGLRIHLDALYHEGDERIDDRFGLTKDDIEYILSDLKNTNLNLTTIHYHQRGFDYEEDKFKINFLIGFNYYLKAKKLYDSVHIFDIGGGAPLPIKEHFDYDRWAKYVLNMMIELALKENIDVPNLMLENGKFSQKDSTVNIYKVIGIKETYKYPWYVVDGSLLIAMPEMYALGEPIEVRQINNLNNDTKKAMLAGVTCDCDDIYPFDGKNQFMVHEGNEIYIGLMGTGSYQNSMNGKGGVHHCLLPEERDIVIEDGKEYERHHLQTIDDIYKIINFK